ncbi:hypothetical protein I316_01541 [Kwoniella heveanensis BCC8398]|uniref:asparaginase n=1 Tax=Kwoniella heveanensis BCC8398 TaxID=1296120 RepID=A0A1B9H0Y5_9TREE|nr:hypothetical protein I316_01541 [Kwoniella heveanensis BCC8398]
MLDISGNSNIDDIAYGGGSEITAQEFIERHVPEVLKIAQVLIVPDVPMTAWIRIAQHFNEYSRRCDDIVGAVLIRATNSLEEVAFGLDVIIQGSKPFILSGAMRPALSLSSDGPLNLYNAIATAISPLSRDRGAMVVFGGKIVSAYYVAKTNANSVDTFKSFEQGNLGIMLGGRPMFYFEPAQPMGKRWFDVKAVKEDELPKVLILYSHIDQDASLIEAAVRSGAKGIVIAGGGIGVLAKQPRQIAELVATAGTPVVVAARPFTGVSVPVLLEDLLIHSERLNALQARIQLQLALATGVQAHKDIREMFEGLFHEHIFKGNWGTAQRRETDDDGGAHQDKAGDYPDKERVIEGDDQEKGEKGRTMKT